jgi:hypothetical protein
MMVGLEGREFPILVDCNVFYFFDFIWVGCPVAAGELEAFIKGALSEL